MANKREFKKYAEAIGASACCAMTDAYYNVENVDKNAVAKAMEKVLGATAAAKANANIFFEQGAKGFADRKAYSKAKEVFFKKLFNKIATDFNAQIEEALKIFNAALPAEAKEEQKKAVAGA